MARDLREGADHKLVLATGRYGRGVSFGIASRWADWYRQADADLAHARHALVGGFYEWACFAAQQAAEKAVKASYPNGLPAGAPADYYTRAEAERALADAEAILAWCQRELPR